MLFVEIIAVTLTEFCVRGVRACVRLCL